MTLLGMDAPLVLDIGANVGQSISSYRKLFPLSRIHAFEPNPAVYHQLEKVWGQTPGIVLEQIGLADKSGTYPFYATRVPEAGSLLKPSDKLIRLSTSGKYDYERIKVVCDTVDDYLSSMNIPRADIMKVDVQGNELAVLQGATTSLASETLTLLYIEITLAETYDSQSEILDIFGILHRLGYVLWDFMPFLYTTPGRAWAANTIFLSRTAASCIEK